MKQIVFVIDDDEAVRHSLSYLLRQVQSEAGPWVGLSVVHLGDRDVPNGLVFIDKCVAHPSHSFSTHSFRVVFALDRVTIP